mmetsp:Transcript_106165/g.300223  ORF Transcript_106165/g.300223 Transcript_106165/m.300223 type:complete len:214 (-) Transcript_106165:249-890(-)
MILIDGLAMSPHGASQQPSGASRPRSAGGRLSSTWAAVLPITVTETWSWRRPLSRRQVFMPCRHCKHTSRPKKLSAPFVCGKNTDSCELLRRKANSRVAPKASVDMQFAPSASRPGNLPASRTNGSSSGLPRYQEMRTARPLSSMLRYLHSRSTACRQTRISRILILGSASVRASSLRRRWYASSEASSQKKSGTMITSSGRSALRYRERGGP